MHNMKSKQVGPTGQTGQTGQKEQNEQIKILFTEDDALIASGLIYALQQEGYLVTHCKTVGEGEAEIKKNVAGFQLAILDLSLPDGTGFQLLQQIREVSTMPVIVLTAVDDEGNVVKGLELGADDYVTKPFRLREFLARIKTALRRRALESQEIQRLGRDTHAQDIAEELTVGDIRVNLQAAEVCQGGQEVLLTAQEYRLLLYFLQNKDQVLPRGRLLERIWDVDARFVNDNTVTVYIKRLREKLGDNGPTPKLIETVRGLGYRLNSRPNQR